jgi:alkylation response protein AidB-like acyl-CoA dehydrogenase
MRTLGGMNVGATFYDDVVVPRHRLLGAENEGWTLIREAMGLDRAAGIAYGHLPVLLDAIIDYARTQTRDGQPLRDIPAVQDGVARLAIDVEAAGVIQDMTASKTAAGLDVSAEAATLKVFCTELEMRLTNFAVELVGTDAPVIDERPDLHPLVRAANRAQRLNVAITIAGGTNEIQRNIIATQALGMAREPRLAGS